MFDLRRSTPEIVQRLHLDTGLRTRVGRACAFFVAVAMLLAAAPTSAQDPTEFPSEYAEPQAGIENGSYGFIRVVDGTATLLQSGGERVRAQANEPLLVGDQVWVAVGSHAELLLADRNIVRLDGGAELALEALAYSADRNDPGTVLDLRRGTLQIVVADDFIGQQPTVRTPNSSILLREPGSYLVIVQEGASTALVVRRGTAEVRSAADAAEVRTGEELQVAGSDGVMRFAQARGLDRLERWAQGLSAGGEYVEHVEEDLQYEASSLNQYGSWVLVGSRHAWRPYGVAVSWRPYWHGRWRWTPSGMFWVSYEPWGWVPYHYGAWDFVAGYGWVWFPGYRFAPAHVYWYWGPRFAGWVPHGYYWRHYRRFYGDGFYWHRGPYGYVGGHSRHFRHWTFSPLGRVGHRHQNRYVVTGVNLEKRNERIARGLLTTDTRRFTPERWQRPAELLRVATENGRAARDLPNANPFLERVRKLPANLERITVRERGTDARTASRGAAGGARAPNIESRQRSQVLERSGVERSRVERGGVERTGIERRSSAELRRPQTQGRDAASRPGVRAPERRGQETPEVRRPSGQERSPTVRRPTATPRSQPTARRPNETRTSSPTLRRPESGGARSAPQVRRPSETREKATTLRRPNETRTSSPAVRRPSSAPERSPTVRRPTATPRSQPTVRRPTATPRSQPTARRPSSSSRSQPTARRPSSGQRSSPSARRSSSRPSAPRPSATPRSSRSPSVSRPSVRSGSRSGGSVRRGTSSRGTSRGRRPSKGD
jgi:hypothetical protein